MNDNWLNGVVKKEMSQIGWISVLDVLPKHLSEVIVACQYEPNGPLERSHSTYNPNIVLNENGNDGWIFGSLRGVKVYYWMPYPALAKSLSRINLTDVNTKEMK